ncbi:MAG: polyprenyl synthetase family protein, partial [candidate division Zixibacteria bacterium]|nr:polyprenyl synthetase family protein [candidate division Zixibacteria bacterium]
MEVAFLDQKREMIDDFLDSELPPIAEHPQGLHAAIRYSALAPAKRIRPILALTTYEALCSKEAPPPAPLAPACALELVHTYSLIHDDLPC